MRLRSLEFLRLAIPFTDGSDAMGVETGSETGVATGFTASKRMESLIVRLETEEGRVGWGEAFGHSVNPASMAALVSLVGPLFKGADLGPEGEAAGQLLAEAERFVHLFGRTGPVIYALSGIEIALWDLRAQALGQPLWQLLGGRNRPLACYASLIAYGENPEAVARNAAAAAARGFTAIKLHERSAPAIAAARAALPSGIALMTDVNCPWSLLEARENCAALKSLQLAWIEGPIWPPDAVYGLASLRREGHTIAAGENASGIEGLKRYLESGAVDILQPSVAKLGGVAAMREAFALGRRHGVRLQPHCYYIGPGLLATAHLLTLLDDAALELPWLDFAEGLCAAASPEPVFHLPEGPGLGFAPDPALLERYAIARARVF